MKLIIGLGNVGREYEGTRHNVGFAVLNQFMGNLGWERKDKFEAETARVENLVLAKPVTLMNNSGRAVKKLSDFYKIVSADLWVIHDDLDIKLGEYKLQRGVGPKVHRGILSIEEFLGDKDFWRVRVGVDGRNGEREVLGEDYVLTSFENQEKEEIEKVIKRVGEQLREIV